MTAAFLEDIPKGCIINLQVQPRASRNALGDQLGDRIKLYLTSPPVDGAANKACLAFLARQLKIPKRELELLSGHKSRQKRILILAVTAAEVAEKLAHPAPDSLQPCNY